MSGPRLTFVTLGCPKNEVDTDRMRASAVAAGCVTVEDLEDADIAVLNTCAFIQPAVEESIDVILDLAQGWKAERAGRQLVVTGCLPSRYANSLGSELPEVDAFVPVADEGGLVSVLARLTGSVIRAQTLAEGTTGRTVANGSAYLQVSDGCHRRCTFCTIPAIRGDYRSSPAARIEAEARDLVAAGAREIVLVGQDISAYGRDTPGDGDLPGLVRRLSRIEGLSWLRLMYVQPDGVTEELLEVMASEPVVCDYLDIPLQHASERILRAMGRAGSGDAFLDLLSKVRSYLPDVSLRTSLIAGFPGETRADVTRLEHFLREARFDHAGVFQYCAEEGTPAATLPDLPHARTRRARAQRLTDAAAVIGAQRAERHVGRTLDVIVGQPEDDEAVGRTRHQAPDVDGVVMLDRPAAPGDLLSVVITDSVGYDLIGEVR
jgi:ribosomal protein S12 methylthiotransferase